MEVETLNKSISEMSTDELQRMLIDLRQSRRKAVEGSFKKKKEEKGTKAAKAKSKRESKDMFEGKTKEELEALLKKMGG